MDETYWQRMRARLDVSDDVRHVQFAQFVFDACGGKLRFVEGPGWHRFDGKRWVAAESDAPAFQVVTDASQALVRRAAAEPADRPWILPAVSKMDVANHRKAIVGEMENLADFHMDVDRLDSHPHLLNFQNGTVDLRSGELRDFNPDDFLTQITNVDYVPDAECPRWQRFMAEIFPHNEDLREYMQRFLGYCITGESREHMLGVWYGAHGRNGKGTIVRTMDAIFGKDIVHEVDFSMYEGGRGNREPHSEDMAALRSARMVVAQEGEDGKPMNTARLKKHSGGDRIQARHLYGRPFTFKPKFCLVLATNHLPEFSAGGAALWARTKAVFFGEHFVGDRVDPELEPTIQGPEAEGVAAWIVRGAVAYYAAGRLHDVESVREATEQHKGEVDPLKPLVGEVFEYDEGGRVKRAEFNAKLKEWRDTNGDDNVKFKPSTVKKHLAAQNVEERQVFGHGWCYVGIRLPEDLPSEQREQRTVASIVS